MLSRALARTALPVACARMMISLRSTSTIAKELWVKRAALMLMSACPSRAKTTPHALKRGWGQSVHQETVRTAITSVRACPGGRVSGVTRIWVSVSVRRAATTGNALMA